MFLFTKVSNRLNGLFVVWALIIRCKQGIRGRVCGLNPVVAFMLGLVKRLFAGAMISRYLTSAGQFLSWVTEND